MHIVEQLIAERAERLTTSRAFPLVRPALYRMLAYDAAVFLADAIRPLTGHEAFTLVTDHLKVRTGVRGLENVPKSGPAFLVANHPTGLADGLAVFQALRDRRPDMVFLANADALRVIPRGRDIVIPVEWRPDQRTRAKSRRTLLDIKGAVDEGKLIVIFPSGRLAKLGWTGLRERPWQSSAFMMARRYDVPVIPLRIRARNSLLYYGFSALNSELRDITLFHELLNKKNHHFRLDFGDAVTPGSLADSHADASTYVRDRLFRL